MKLAKTAMALPTSGVRKMMELAWGRDDVVHLEVGEPGFDTPAHVLEAARWAAEVEGRTKYSPTPGLPQLRQALVEKVRSFNHIQVPSSEQVLVANGGANALFSIFGSVLDPGDSILLPNPGWSNFNMMALASGARPIFYDLDESTGYLPDPKQIDALITDSTRAVVFNSPSNPLGSVIPPALAEELLEVCAARDVWIISDECYDAIDFSGNFVSLGSRESQPERVISVFSFSKVYAMTGWRVGYCVLPPPVVNPVLGLMQSSVMCVNTPAQYGALAAVTGVQSYLNDWRGQYRANRDLVVDKIAGSRYQASIPDGGFYVWLDVSTFGLGSEEFALQLLDRCNVAVTPGTAFGTNGEGRVRLSLATTKDKLEEGMDRMLKFS
jgi:aspartate aminotransferase